MSSRIALICALLLIILLTPLAALSEDLLIISPDQFIDRVLPLKRFKDYTGRPAILIALTDVYNNFPGADQAEQVKKCIAYYEQQNGIKYVILVGDVDVFPCRWIWWGRQGENPDSTIREDHWSVSDLYYADLYRQGTKSFVDWDANANGLYGEIEFSPDGYINNDNIDILPDVSVSRIPASSGAEVEAYVKKVIKYELRTAPWDDWFKKFALYTGTWDRSENDISDAIGDLISPLGYTLLKRHTDWTIPTRPVPYSAGWFLSDLNSGVGLVNYMGHGNSDSLACIGVGTNEIASLSNSDVLPVVFAAACDTGMFARMARFHAYVSVNGIGHCGTDNGEILDPGSYPHYSLPHPAPVQNMGTANEITCCPPSGCENFSFDRPCFAETILFGNPTGAMNGAIAYMGLRTNGQATTSDLSRYFFETYSQGYYILGEVWRGMVEKYYNQYNLRNSSMWYLTQDHWPQAHIFDEPHKLIVFGDSSLQVGGAFRNAVGGNVYDGYGGSFATGSRYRVVTDISVPFGQRLSALPSSAVLFQSGSKITASDAGQNNGFIAAGDSQNPVSLLSQSSNPQYSHLVRGVIVRDRLKIRNGGAIKFY